MNKEKKELTDNLFKNIKLYVFTSIITSLKFILDFRINISDLCQVVDINYEEYIKTEVILLQGLNWEIFLDNNDFILFKTKLEHYND